MTRGRDFWLANAPEANAAKDIREFANKLTLRGPLFTFSVIFLVVSPQWQLFPISTEL